MVHGEQRGIFDLEFGVPSECADRLASGEADIGIVPSVEAARLKLKILPGQCIASDGEVRSILLISKKPLDRIETLAAHSSSRTSVALCRIILARRYGAEPAVTSQPPNVDAMLASADAALLIGDPALQFDPTSSEYLVTDLGREWAEMTGLPMVFAVWAGPAERVTPDLEEPFTASYQFGRSRLEEICTLEGPPRGLSPSFVREYFTRNVRHDLGPREMQGLERFLQYAGEAAILESTGNVLTR
jgi:predicted solute-binding protein